MGCGVLLLELCYYGFEGFCACVLLESLLNNVVSLLIALCLYLLLELVVVHFVAVFALLVCSELFHQLFL